MELLFPVCTIEGVLDIIYATPGRASFSRFSQRDGLLVGIAVMEERATCVASSRSSAWFVPEYGVH